MSETIADQRVRYPLGTYNFRVTIGETTIGFSEVSGLSQEYETLSYRDGMSHWEGGSIVEYKKPSSEITLKKGVFTGGVTHNLYGWMKSGEKRLLIVDLCDEQKSPVISWRVNKAMVTKLEAPSFEADSNEVAIETMTLWASDISITHVRWVLTQAKKAISVITGSKEKA